MIPENSPQSKTIQDVVRIHYAWSAESTTPGMEAQRIKLAGNLIRMRDARVSMRDID
jgi:hypothetical protein